MKERWFKLILASLDIVTEILTKNGGGGVIEGAFLKESMTVFYNMVLRRGGELCATGFFSCQGTVNWYLKRPL